MRERKWDKETGKHTVPNNRGFITCRLEKIGRKKGDILNKRQ